MTIKYRKLTEAGDMTFGQNQSNFYIDNPEAVGQSVLTRLKLWAGEWFLDLVEGTPYQIGGLGKYTKATIDPMIRERIIDTDGVKSIISYSSEINPNTRNFTVEVVIDTVYGETTVTGVF